MTWLNTTQSEVGDAGKERKQVCSNSVSVDVHLRVRLYHGRQVYLVNIHQRIGTDDTVTSPEIFVRSLKLVIENGPCRNWNAMKR